MKTTIQKWGNSLGVRIPGHIAKDLALKSGSSVEIIEENNRIVIQPKQNKIAEMLALITDENIHEEQFTGTVGKELL